jgi:hypothetical protein
LRKGWEKGLRPAAETVGWRSALERAAHFLFELLTRLQVIGLADERSYQMPLTQELIGDALGLSVPHVSCTMRQLREEDLVAIEGQRVVIKDAEALSRLADFERAYLGRYHRLRRPGPAHLCPDRSRRLPSNGTADYP